MCVNIIGKGVGGIGPYVYCGVECVSVLGRMCAYVCMYVCVFMNVFGYVCM